MNTIESYIYRVYTEKSFSGAAKILHISQPSLSAAIAHKERELGFRIFDRTTKPISITSEGQIYIDMLNEFLESESNMKLRMQKLFNNEHNLLSIGGSFSSVYYLMPLIMGEFSTKYPGVRVKFDIGSFRADPSLYERFSIFQKLDKNEIDLIFCYGYDDSKYTGYPIYRERAVAAMHKDMLTEKLMPYALTKEELLSKSYGREKEIREDNLFENIPFLEFHEASELSKLMPKLLGKYLPSPYKLTNAIHYMVHYYMSCAGVAAVFTNDCVVALSGSLSDDMRYFVFDKEDACRYIYLAERKDSTRNINAEKFTELAQKNTRSCRSAKRLSKDLLDSDKPIKSFSADRKR